MGVARKNNIDKISINGNDQETLIKAHLFP